MKIHHLNCGTMCPACQRLINGYGSWLKPAKLCCHCLLIETKQSLVLIDTGFGTQDIKNPNKNLGLSFRALTRPKLDLSETALYQIKALGYSPSDVTDIFPTHLDLDHAGGLSDFPQATVHIYQAELDYALKPKFKDRTRYRAAQFSHQPRWQSYNAPSEDWFGLDSFDCAEQLGFELNLIPLIGHTWGHAAIAIKQNDQWLMHCGDAYFHHTELDNPADMPIGLKFFEQQVETNRTLRLDSLQKLQHLKKNHPDIKMFCAHDETELLNLQKLSTI